MNNAPYNQRLNKPTPMLKTLRNRETAPYCGNPQPARPWHFFTRSTQQTTTLKNLSETVPPPVACFVNQSATLNHLCVPKQHMFSPETEPTIPKLKRSLKQYKSTKTLTTKGVPVSGKVHTVVVRRTTPRNRPRWVCQPGGKPDILYFVFLHKVYRQRTTRHEHTDLQ